jgi:hypothetical protein
MTFARWALILPVVWGIQVAAQDASPPTQLEQALIEHVCNASRVAGAVESGAYQSCLTLKLTSIRADFGRDLSNLSVSDRKTIDTTCSKVLETGDRDAHVDCLSGQLTVPARAARVRSAPSAAASSPAPAASSDAAAAPAESSAPSVIWIGIGIDRGPGCQRRVRDHAAAPRAGDAGRGEYLPQLRRSRLTAGRLC